MVFDHIPSMKVFRRTAVLSLLTSLPVAAVFGIVWPDTLAVMIPVILTCIVLMQERFKLGRYRAWITNRRVILQGGREVQLLDLGDVKKRLFGVHLGGAGVTLAYVDDKPALANAITGAQAAAKQSIVTQEAQ